MVDTSAKKTEEKTQMMLKKSEEVEEEVEEVEVEVEEKSRGGGGRGGVEEMHEWGGEARRLVVKG